MPATAVLLVVVALVFSHGLKVTVFTTELLNLGLELCEYAGVPPGVHLVLQEVVGWLSQQYHRNREYALQLLKGQREVAERNLLWSVSCACASPPWTAP